MANAETQTMAKDAIIAAVKATLTLLNICLNCFMKPRRKPVPVSETITPTEYNTAKVARDPVRSNMEPNRDMTKPANRQAAKPMMRCCRVSSRPNILEKASFSPVSSPRKLLIWFVSILIHRDEPVPANAPPLLPDEAPLRENHDMTEYCSNTSVRRVCDRSRNEYFSASSNALHF